MGEFAWWINGLVNEEARGHCKGCEMDDFSQLDHICMTMEQEEIWIKHFERPKAHLNVNRLWSEIEKKILAKLNGFLDDSCFKYFLQLIKVHVTSAFLL